MRNYDFPYLNQPRDVSDEFTKEENQLFLGARLDYFDAASASGDLRWERHSLRQRMSFNQVTPVLEKSSWKGRGASFNEDKNAEEFPVGEYDEDHVLPFSLSFVSERTVRLQLSAQHSSLKQDGLPMLAAEPLQDVSWEISDSEGSVAYRGEFGSVTVTRDPWRVEYRDPEGRLLTATRNFAEGMSLINLDPAPFSFVRSSSDLRRRISASFSLSPDEKIFGCGESFTRLDKRGQKVPLWTIDAHSAQTPDMYKPVPFFVSNRGYGMFVHTSAPLTLDFGRSYDSTNTIYLDDDRLDLFVFLGSPKDILTEYTALTGRSPVPPLWSFGLWMSRITYESEAEARNVAEKLRDYQIPSDVIHLDTGWFEEDWRCDYKFSSKFDDPKKMITDLDEQGFKISLWQLPYFTPKNRLHDEIVENGLAVQGSDGGLPTEDAILDFSNPAAVSWYQGKLKNLLEMGVGAIKVDFGEAAPAHGVYASGMSGRLEHNLYPLRYNKAAAEITQRIAGENVIWARSAWAGSQRYPLHWGGDAENTDGAMAASLRAGLSLGLCGFSFWSHDIGGFVNRTPRDLYRRWVPFGMLTSHSRCHGAPPKEPWEYDEELTDDFRRAVELKYRLMPYVYAQAKLCSERGFPMMRTLFFEYPEDRTSWLVEDEYLFGDSLLVAPLMEEVTSREVYLPPGTWIDYQSGHPYTGAAWHEIDAEEVPIIMLVRDGTVVPQAKVAQHTRDIDWHELELRVFAADTSEAEGYVCLPEEGVVHKLRVEYGERGFSLVEDPLEGQVDWISVTS